jgi:LDH2 family malate/lactate/ureidoglycolate dehydrogenase
VCSSDLGLGSPAGNPERMRRHIQNSTVAAIDISQFTDVESYKEHIDSLIDGIKGLPKAEGFSEIFVPGEPEWRTMDQRMKSGIPIPEKTFANLSKVGERFGLKLTAE